ncbi:Malate dehydrogenase, cytoplasmic [Nucella lapillus]
MNTEDKEQSEPVKVCVTGAAGHIAYSLLFSIAKGDVFGKDQPVIITLLDIETMKGVLDGMVMELMDCAMPLLKQVIPTTNEEEAFKDVDAAFLVGAVRRKTGMEMKDLLEANVKIFHSQGLALDQWARKTVKVVVVGNPVNTNAMVCSRYAPTIPKENFSCLTRLDHNRAQAQIASRLGVANSCVNNVIIWGNHSSTQFPDVRHSKVLFNGKIGPVPLAVKDDSYLKNEFIWTVQNRTASVIEARKLSSAMSVAKAAVDHMHDWWFGTKKDQWVSMGVLSNGSYGIPEGIMYSFPVRIVNRQWEVVENLEINDFAREKMDITAKELCSERDTAMLFCNQ